MDDDIIEAFQKLYPGIAAWYEYELAAGEASSGRQNGAVSALAVAGSERNEGRFRLDPSLLGKLLEGALFSQKLIATYYIVIGGLIVLVGLWNWLPRLWNLHSTKELNGVTPACVTKGLLHAVPPSYGAANSDNNDHDNHQIRTSIAPVDAEIQRDHRPSPSPKKSRIASIPRKLHYKLKSWLIYQPRPLPIVHKVLPPNSTSLAILTLLCINIFYTLYKIPFSLDLIFLFATRCGLLFVANLPLLYLLAAKNTQPLLYLTGHAYETLNIYHRRLGEYMCLLALLHCAGILAVYLNLRRPDFTWAQFLSEPVVALGLAAFACYEALYATSLGAVRQTCYEVFLAVHVFLQIVALGLVFFHEAKSRVYVGAAIGIFFLDRVVIRMVLRPVTLGATSTIHPDKATTTLSVAVPRAQSGRWALFRRPSIQRGWKPAQHVFVSVPSLGATHALQSHPLTIASAAPSGSPPADSRQQTTDLSLLVRAKSGFSAALLRYARTRPSIKVRLDGPYGSDSALRLLREADVALLVAGGSGIAVVWPLVVALLEGGKGEVGAEDSVSGDEDERRGLLSWKAREIVLVWIVRETEHVEWLGAHALDWARARGVRVLMPVPTEYGRRPDVKALVEGVVRGVDGDVDENGRKVRVVCSGPEELSRDVRNACSRVVGRGADVEIEVHKYGW